MAEKQKSKVAPKAQPEQLFRLGVARQRAGRLREAEQIFRDLLRSYPNHVESLNQLGLLAIEGKAPGQAVELIGQALRQRRNDPTLLTNYANALLSDGKAKDALRYAKKAVKLVPDAAQSNCILARTLRSLDRSGEAITYFKRAIEIQPQFGQALLGLGRSLSELGQHDAAVPIFRKVIASAPHSVAPHIGLAQAKRFTNEDPETDQLLALCRRTDLNEAEAVEINYAAGKILDDLGRYDDAFGHFKTANDLTKTQFDQNAHGERTAKVIALTTREFFDERKGFGNPSRRPVFIVGMPRSGTTLVEQILSAHPDVYGAGEIETLYRVAKNKIEADLGTEGEQAITRLRKKDYAALADDYLKEATRHAGTSPRVIDKLPHNFERLHFVALMFPNAKVIHCKRNPIDTCLSCYMKNFLGTHGYNTDLKSLASHYKQYEALMAHWHGVLPLEIFDIEYEKLVEEPETMSRKLVAHVGLDWHDDCLRFHEVRRSVRTPSNWQVRQPVYRRSVERWRRYERHLEPLLAAFRS